MRRLILVAGAWCFFRAGSLSQAVYVLGHSVQGMGHPLAYIKNGFAAFDKGALLWLVFPLILLGVYDYTALTKDPLMEISGLRKPIRYTIYYAFIFITLLLASFNSQEFVYFQF